MADMWRKPYHVVIEVENKQCQMLKKFAAHGLKHLKVVDIRSSSTGAVKHLIELDREQAAKIPQGIKMAPRRGRAEGKPHDGLMLRVAKCSALFNWDKGFFVFSNVF